MTEPDLPVHTVVFQGVAVPECVDDSGTAVVLAVEDETSVPRERGMFVRVQSWSDDCQHPEAMPILGRRVRITIEVLETEDQMLRRETDLDRREREDALRRLTDFQEEYAQR